MSSLPETTEYRYSHAQLGCAHKYLLPTITNLVDRHFDSSEIRRRLFDLGCGNGSVANHFHSRGYEVVGVDPSAEGVAEANKAYPDLRIEIGSAYDDLPSRFGTFPAVISLEVVEHVYAPRQFARTVFDLLDRDGIAVISTPFHGYLKNIAVAITSSFDKHVNPLWDHGHIKFWSIKTLTQLLRETGFERISFHRVGRIPMLAKSMIAVATKP